MATLEEPLHIEIGTSTISGTLVTPGTLIPGVLFVHGWGGSQAQYLARAREIAALGCVCLTFDLRGHAERGSEYATVTREQNLHDVVAAYDTLVRRRHIDTQAIAVVGSSYGGYLASILSAVRAVKWLALRAPALYYDDGWDTPKLQLHKDHDLRAYRRTVVPVASNRALQATHAFEGDLLLIESEHDDMVPRTTLASYREAARNTRSLTYRCIAGADHGLTSERDQLGYSTTLVAWLKEMIGGARGVPAPVAPAPVLARPEAA
jgi:uncharacterized protein